MSRIPNIYDIMDEYTDTMENNQDELPAEIENLLYSIPDLCAYCRDLEDRTKELEAQIEELKGSL